MISPLPPAFQSFLEPFYRFIFPPTCFVCEGSLSNGEYKVCNSCWSRVAPADSKDEVYRETLARLVKGGSVSGLVSAFYFDQEGPLQAIIHELKYGGMTSLGVELGRKLGERLASVLSAEMITGSIPVPLHPAKLRERGYNQSEYICKGVQATTGLEVFPTLLRRRRYTQSQTKLNIDERKANVNEAFAINSSYESRVRDGTFILVDDVITTGATIDECARVLVDHGARRVVACSIALAP